MSVELIYKTTDREALHWWRELEAERAAVMERRDAYEAKALELYGPMGSRYNSRTMHSDHKNERRLIVQGHRAVGLACRIDEVPPEGSGWPGLGRTPPTLGAKHARTISCARDAEHGCVT